MKISQRHKVHITLHCARNTHTHRVRMSSRACAAFMSFKLFIRILITMLTESTLFGKATGSAISTRINSESVRIRCTSSLSTLMCTGAGFLTWTRNVTSIGLSHRASKSTCTSRNLVPRMSCMIGRYSARKKETRIMTVLQQQHAHMSCFFLELHRVPRDTRQPSPVPGPCGGSPSAEHTSRSTLPVEVSAVLATATGLSGSADCSGGAAESSGTTDGPLIPASGAWPRSVPTIRGRAPEEDGEEENSTTRKVLLVLLQDLVHK